MFYIYSDHLGAPRVAVDDQGRTRWRWLTEPFGTTPAETNPSGLGDLNISLRLPGQQYDGFVGLHFNGFRDYDAGNGRYVQSDPIGLEGGINTYAYVEGNPLSGADPQGLANSSMTRYLPRKRSDWPSLPPLPAPDAECMEELLKDNVGPLAGLTKEFSALSLFPNRANIDQASLTSDLTLAAGVGGKCVSYRALSSSPNRFAQLGAKGLHVFGEYVSGPLTVAATLENAAVSDQCSCMEKQDPGRWQRLRQYRQLLQQQTPVFYGTPMGF